MKEILFRAKQIDDGEWVEGYYAMMGKGNLIRHYIVQNCALTGLFEDPEDNMYFNDVEIDPETLCQYTGLNDGNGKRIWENDIVKHERSDTIGTVKWYQEDYVGWCVDDVCIDEQQFTDEMWNECEVIGNAFDDKHLLDKSDYCREQGKETED